MAEQHAVTLLMSEFVTHDVKRLLVSRPPGFTFEPGQGVELAINRPQWQITARLSSEGRLSLSKGTS